MTNPFRVTPEMALWGYAKTGMLASVGVYVDGPAHLCDAAFTCGCPAGVLAVAAGIDPARSVRQVSYWLAGKAGAAYEAGFTAAYDAEPGQPIRYLLRPAHGNVERLKQGEQDGREVRLAVQAAGLMRRRYEPWRTLRGPNRRLDWLAEHCPDGFRPV